MAKLTETGRNGERQMPPPKESNGDTVSLAPTLSDLQISRKQSTRWHEIARIHGTGTRFAAGMA
jgi:hypothetical protein